MLKNYFIIALRNIRKHSFYSSINIFGLAVFVAACLFIMLYVTDEWSNDKFHKDKMLIIMKEDNKYTNKMKQPVWFYNKIC
jgi:hypothetical protein